MKSLIELLKNRSLYPHPVKKIQVMETHISWVLLTGLHAYKIKKPVNLGFLDFTKLEDRKFFCEEEIRINRRFAPQIYQKVIPITGSLENPRLAGKGPAIEYAVQMVQFPQEARLASLLKRGTLKPEYLSNFATSLASLHTEVPVAPAKSEFGRPQNVFQPIAQTLDQLGGLLRSPQDLKLLQSLEKWCVYQKKLLEPFMNQRKRAGFVRECHGDAHLGNMVLLKEKVVLFDAIEFAANLRWIDVMNEVAFTVMDLEDRKRKDLAYLFLNTYLEATGDYEGLKVLRLYLLYRALVRAKVASIRLTQPDLKKKELKKTAEQVRSYLHLAQNYTTPSPPRLYITHGFSGSGKTHETTQLLQKIPAIRLRTDVERKRMFGLDPLETSRGKLKEEMYRANTTRRLYKHLSDLAGILLKAGFSVIVDGTFLKREHRALFRQLTKRCQAPFGILEFQVSETQLLKRIRGRKKTKDASEADENILSLQMETAEPLTKLEKLVVVALQKV